MRQTIIEEVSNCFNAVATYNADAFICENDETMQEVADFINGATEERILTKDDGQDYDDAAERLGFEQANSPERIHVFRTDDETLFICFDNEY